MENYIVRIYGRDPGDSDRVTGMLESVEQETRRPFHSLNALRSMLDAAAAGDRQDADPISIPRIQRKDSLTPTKSTRRLDN
jgi:hypothetical protein